MLTLAAVSLVLAGVPCLLFCANLRLYREPPPAPAGPLPAVSVLIPARNEAGGIAEAVRSVLASEDVELEVVVMDDHSGDGTAAIVHELALQDPRVRLELAPALPAGWNGKQHACWQLAQCARHSVLCFVDADVRLEPSCVSRMAGFLLAGDRALVSGFPRQVTGTALEWLLLPIIHFVLLGFLPLARMRAGTDPGFAAGCGQFMMARREPYFAVGGHTGIRETMHDGLRLPRLFREHGLRTDLADLTAFSRCRMYTSAAQVWLGLAKNATEGIAAPARILPVTLLLVLGQVLPFAVLAVAAVRLLQAHLARITFRGEHAALEAACWGLAAFAAWLPRLLAAVRFRQDLRSALLHPAGIVLLLVLQWYALLRQLRGNPVSWKSRAYASRP